MDADFSGGWPLGEHLNPECVRSFNDFFIMSARCPLAWDNNLQTEIARSTTYHKYIKLCQTMSGVTSFMNLMVEVQQIFPLNNPKLRFYSKAFEDNCSCIKVQCCKSPKCTPWTKHIVIKCCHFWKHIIDGSIIILSISNSARLADIFTKALGRILFSKLQYLLMGW